MRSRGLALALLFLASFLLACSSEEPGDHPAARGSHAALAFITPAFGDGVVAVDAETLEIVWRRAPHGSPRAGRPMHLAVSDRRLYVGNLDGPGIVVLDASNGDTLAHVALPHEVVGIVVAPYGVVSGTARHLAHERAFVVTGARDARETYLVGASWTLSGP